MEEEDNVVSLIQLFKWTAEYRYEQGSLDKVADYLHKARKIQQKYYGASSAELVETEYELAAVFEELTKGRMGLVLKDLEERRIRFKVNTSKPSSSACFGILAQANLLMGKKTEALKLFKLAVDQRSELYGPEAPITRVAEYRLLKASVETNKPGAYTSKLQEMYANLSALLGRNHHVVEDLMKTLAVDLHKQGRKKGALKLFRTQASLDYPKMNDTMVAFTAHILMAAAFARKGMEVESLAAMEKGLDLSGQFGGPGNSYAALAASLYGGLLRQLDLDVVCFSLERIDKSGSPPELIDLHRRMNIWFRDVYPTLEEDKNGRKDANIAMEQSGFTGTKNVAGNLGSSFEVKYNQAKDLILDFKYDEAFRSLMKLYNEQAEAIGYADEAAVKTLKTLDCWELRPEFVSHPVLVEAYKFFERVIPKVQAASTRGTSKDWIYQLHWRQGFIMSKTKDCSFEKANQPCLDAFKHEFLNLQAGKFGLSFWQEADRTDSLLILSTFTPLIEELLQGREKIMYQNLIQLDKAKSGRIREVLRALISLYQKAVNELKIHDPLLVFLLQSIYEVYKMITDRKSLAEKVNFFKSKLQHFKHKLGADHPSTLTVQEMFCCSLIKWTTEKPDLKTELVSVIDETAEKTSRVLGDKHLVTIKAKENLSAVMRNSVFCTGAIPRPEKVKQLEELVNNIFDTYAEIYGKEHPEYWNQCLVLSKLYAGPLLKPDRALQLAEEGYAGMSERYGKDSAEATKANEFISRARMVKFGSLHGISSDSDTDSYSDSDSYSYSDSDWFSTFFCPRQLQTSYAWFK